MEAPQHFPQDNAPEADAILPTEFGDFRIRAFRDPDGGEEHAVLYLGVDVVRFEHPVANRDAHVRRARHGNVPNVRLLHPRRPVPPQLTVALGRAERSAEGLLVHARLEPNRVDVGSVAHVGAKELIKKRGRQPRLEH